MTWDPTQSYLVSVSLDQTARLLAPWRHQEEGTTGNTVSTWHEIARPQIHGYDAQCIAFSDKWTFVSGSDEKVLRVFDAPQTFVRSLAQLTGNDAVLADEVMFSGEVGGGRRRIKSSLTFLSETKEIDKGID